MRCPNCHDLDTRVLETRPVEDSSVIRRRRECSVCACRFTTYERMEMKPLFVVKKDGKREVFDREKLLRGVSRACEKLPVSLEEIESLVSRVEGALKGEGPEVASDLVGQYVMDELAMLNKVAYVRFASVYREFTDLNSFQREISSLLERGLENHS